MEIKVENSGEFAYLMEEFANIIKNSEKNSENNQYNLTFGQALEALKNGKRVTRKGWNGKKMFLCFVHWKDWSVNPAETHKTSTHLASRIGMRTADNMFVPWLASQTDMLAEDWEIVK